MRMERQRGGEGQKEQVVRRVGLMSNERLTRLQLILSLNLLVGRLFGTKVIMTPSSIILFILVIQKELPNNMLQICPPSYNSVCHSQYIIRKTHIALSTGHSLRIIVGDTFGMQPEFEAFFFFFTHKVELPRLICHCQKHNKPFRAKGKVEQVLIGFSEEEGL